MQICNAILIYIIIILIKQGTIIIVIKQDLKLKHL